MKRSRISSVSAARRRHPHRWMIDDDDEKLPLRQLYFMNLTEDRNFECLCIDLWKIKALLALAALAVLLMTVGSASAMISASPGFPASLMFYVVMLESSIFLSTVNLTACYVSIATFCIVLPITRITTKVFEGATRSEDIHKLRVSSIIALVN